MKGKDLVPTIE